jgi:Domain of unknown function (DUF4365)
MSAKTVPNSVFIGNEGAYLVPQLVNEMQFLWTPSGQFELGIDGTIEIVDPVTAKGTGNIIKAQIKTTSQPCPPPLPTKHAGSPRRCAWSDAPYLSRCYQELLYRDF